LLAQKSKPRISNLVLDALLHNATREQIRDMSKIPKIANKAVQGLTSNPKNVKAIKTWNELN